MNVRIILPLFFLLHFAGASFAQNGSFEVKIIQDTVMDPGANNELLLKKAPFKIEVRLNKLEGVYLYAAFKDSIYKITADEKIPGFADIPAMSMAEESFNPDQELITSDDGWAYWFYSKEENWHRFDKKIEVNGDVIIGRKSVKQFYIPALEKSMKVEDVNAPLYLFFFSASEAKRGELANELQRYKIKITWK